ncbi:ornithine--oxo-acid transaminase [Pseudactinotalea sp. HY160]|uniref:ornithine--oxo-acid transaminase n=1 Tax=Pseudactinotalea sp. HY160 TaxID=2654490 RepID=UPI00128B1ACE|nr:ornithine--oxo-acid transaminase [Pseudactinotalea sp. HY160]MPV48595.1 ornithine--oxo-acid transaminase [Pseudactinotalea sp. HY160]
MTSLAHNYEPLPVTLAHGEGIYVTDTSGVRYIDCIAAYSALNFGHRHPVLVEAVAAQLGRLTLTSRAVGHDRLEAFADRITDLTGFDVMLPMNTGAEAVETLIKTARKWAYEVKGVPPGRAEIIVAAGAFHGRTTTVVSASTDPEARGGFGPYTPGFVIVPYGDADAVAAAITPATAGVLLEPIQGEAGVIIPPTDYLVRVRRACEAAGALLMCDEVQSGLGRTGATLDQDNVGVRADLTAIGKALSGGIIPSSAALGREDVMAVMTPGVHGSTFGGNPMAAAVGIAVAELLATGEFQERARVLGRVLAARAAELLEAGLLAGVRCRGLWLGVDVPHLSGRAVAERMAGRGVLVKETHDHTLRLAPPLIITEPELHRVMDTLADVLAEPH